MTQKVQYIPIKRWFDVWLVLTALAAITLVGIRLWATEWTSDLYVLVYLSFFAGVTGIALGYSRFSPLLTALISGAYGLFITGWLFGTTVEMEMAWRDRIVNYLGWRLRIAIEQFIAGSELSDPILFLTLMAIMLWILGSSAAFILIRQGFVWPSLIPLGITLLVISHYDQDLTQNTRFLMAFLLVTLLILGRVTFLKLKKKWRSEGIQITSETQSDFNKTLVIIASSLLLLAWVIPLTPQGVSRYSELWENLTEPWDRFSEQISDIFVVETPPEFTLTGYFGDSMSLGNGSPASESVVFTSRVDVEPPPGYRNYWRTRSYETYQEDEWVSNPNVQERLLFPDNFSIPFPDWEGGEIAAYTFSIEASRVANLYFSGNPIAVSRPVKALTQLLPDSEEDLIALLADPDLVREDTYQVESLVRLPTESALRAASTEYPEWTERYLQLPVDFSADVARLARQVTAGLDNPFDQAFAITRYLRINIEYARTIPTVPAGADPIEWFLFDEMRGFCNYYATAQVMMLRSLGIPARLSVGYAQGEFDPETDTYTVRRRDSHAWPEIYFVGHGWVAFEPTVSQPAFILPAGAEPGDGEIANPQDIPLMDEPTPAPDGPGGVAADTAEQPSGIVRGSRVIWVLLGIFLSIILLLAVIMIRPKWFKINIEPLPVLLERFLKKRGRAVPEWLSKWSRIAQLSPAQRAYRQIGQSIKILGQEINLAETPTERAQTLTSLLPYAKEPILDIIHEYHLDQFSNMIINEERAKNAARQVWQMAIKTRARSLLSFKAIRE